MLQWTSPAQCVGYVAFVLGITAFLQTNDKKLKLLNGAQSYVYCLHFALLGVPAASVSSFVSATRVLTSIKTRAVWVAVTFLILGVALGVPFVKSPAGWLPIIGTCLATFAFFFLEGVPMRSLVLVSTFCWLANNIVSHSIGGMALETTIAIANSATIVRMILASRNARALRASQAHAAAD